MARHRVNKVKRMHSMIGGLLPILEKMARSDLVASITPGRISPLRRATDSLLTFQYFTGSGLKLLAKNPMAVQEVFVVSSQPEALLKWLIQEGLVDNADKPPPPTPNEKRQPSGGQPGSPIQNDLTNRESIARLAERKKGAKRKTAKPISGSPSTTNSSGSVDFGIEARLGKAVAKHLKQQAEQSQAEAEAKAVAQARGKEKVSGNQTNKPKPSDPLTQWLAEVDQAGDKSWDRLIRTFKDEP